MVWLGAPAAAGAGAVGSAASSAERIEMRAGGLSRGGADAACPADAAPPLCFLAAGGVAVDRLGDAGRERVVDTAFPASVPASAVDTEAVSALATPVTGTHPRPRATIPAPTPSHR